MQKIFILLPVFIGAACGQTKESKTETKPPDEAAKPQGVFIKTIGEIPVPSGFHRFHSGDSLFDAWLHAVPLKKDKTVYKVLKVYKVSVPNYFK